MSLVARNAWIAGALAALSTGLAPACALAQDAQPAMPPGMGQPAPWQTGLQAPVTPVMEHLVAFHGMLFWIILAIAVFVGILLLVVILRFNRKANPVASQVTHHTGLEIAWTVVPILVLVFIAIPSFRLLFEEQVLPKADLTVKAAGYQWQWGYEYPDLGVSEYVSKMIESDKLKPGQPRLLAVDEPIVVPVNKVVRVQVTGMDVIHAFTVPSFGIKIDAIPGRLNETWFRATREGVYYGQCSELCGTNHAFMPIEVRVVSDDAFAKWVSTKKAEQNGGAADKVAEAAVPASTAR